jgi:hypothetical protein
MWRYDLYTSFEIIYYFLFNDREVYISKKELLPKLIIHHLLIVWKGSRSEKFAANIMTDISLAKSEIFVVK